jgi:hypothetical protein
MKHLIRVQWVGLRKDANKGSICGWFTLVGQPETPMTRYYNGQLQELEVFCYEFSGKLGKSLRIEKRLLTSEFLTEVGSKRKNFKEQDSTKIMAKWGKSLDEDLSMFLTMERLRG